MKYVQSNSNITALVCVSKSIPLMACGQGNGYFAGLRMTVAKCIILNNYVAG